MLDTMARMNSETIARLKKKKKYEKESYDEVINRLLNEAEKYGF